MNLYIPNKVNKLIICKEEFTFINNSIDVNFPIAFIETNNPFTIKLVYNTYLFEKITRNYIHYLLV